MTVRERIEKLQELMKKQDIQIYIVPTADYHQSEYVGEHFKARKYLTGFTGSAGTAVVLQDRAYLWTDGRYFIQAAQELQGSGIILQKAGEPDVPAMEAFLKQELPESGVIGFDGRTVGVAKGQEYAKIASDKGGSVRYDLDLMDEIWEERPALSEKPAFLLDIRYAGESVEHKLARVREAMEEQKADVLVITSLDDIGWLLNIRGNDVEYFPLLLSYAVVGKDGVELYADERKFSDEMKAYFRENHVTLYPYDGIYGRMKTFTKEQKVMLDPEQMNYALFSNISGEVQKIQAENPIVLMKAVKNPVEAENIRNAHIKDGIAHTKFMYWLKTNIGKERITEMTASAKLEEFRGMQEHYMGSSFGPISAYKEHAACAHYSSTPETDVELKTEGLFLTDTGGHYWEGSTDITRTVALGEITGEMRRHFTTVVCSMLHLADARFLHGCSGLTLDYAAREPFWRQGLNYNHGTGHGVGYLGNIHEPPVNFHWKRVPGKSKYPALEVRMVITDEPGIYIEGSHGIRIENELMVAEGEKNEYGQFLHFEILTYVPIDLDAIALELMTEQEKKLLNDYHQKVYEKIGPHLTEEERCWLREYTRAIG
ncbi:MAG: aminopeptidase P family N-terminal domain-containing protein [Schaedlerella sp.]|uniref:aminopeptidase P family N-terminal domain-containing protein n=1 Tax=Schaedlerella sp. TaxID=2676057 RepID=UPI00261ACA54|nr:aminopeptidase P family N-terminal domain-containing protein [uncultured Schaedlerella sp.]